MGLVRDQGCFADLAWRTQLPETVNLDGMGAALSREGYLREEPGPGLVTFGDELGNTIVIVLRTGRVQIRVSYLIPRPERAEAARRIAKHLDAECGTAQW